MSRPKIPLPIIIRIIGHARPRLSRANRTIGCIILHTTFTDHTKQYELMPLIDHLQDTSRKIKANATTIEEAQLEAARYVVELSDTL